MLGGADNPNGELLSYIIGADNATPFAKKYTPGVLSFAEKELPPGGREKVMASFERVLMPGLEKNQYSIL
ncbi:hypothetical protein NVE84_22795, partial [Escherichia coli]|uniref:hypothetical protein n=1 Tax=Escherichia coli TaxID=562 RepID=UPI0029C19B94